MLEQSTIWIFRVLASLLCACFYFVATTKLVGVLQQSGYRNGRFFRWLGQERNTYLLRLACLSVLSVFSTALFIFVFYFLQEVAAMAMGGIPFFGFAILFFLVDRRYALKVGAVKTGRWQRLAIVYFLLIACLSFGLICLCSLLKTPLGGLFDGLAALRFLPLCLLPLLLPFVAMVANAVLSPFENLHNRKFVARADEALKNSKAVKIGIVGSYGKTSVKNALRGLLSEKYAVVASPASYNTPIGVAKTVALPAFAEAEVAIFEMGARRAGDIKELCDLVQPDYILFTGVCAQHIETFGDLDGVFHAKCEALSSSAKLIVCGGGLRERIEKEYPDALEKCRFVGQAKEIELRADGTAFVMSLQGGDLAVDTCLLGEAAVENIMLAAALAEVMGLTAEEIATGVKKLQQTEHRLQLTKEGGVYILDDAYNCNEKGAKMAIDALKRFSGKKFIITPGIVETGVLHEEINGRLGVMLAEAALDMVVLVGETQVKLIADEYKKAGGNPEALHVVPSLQDATALLQGRLSDGDCVLFMNDLPDCL